MKIQYLGRGSVLGVAAAFGLFFGCGGDTSTGPGDAAPVASNDFAASFASAFCSGISGCCNRQGIPSDPPSCTATLQPYLTTVFAPRLSSPNYTYDAKAAGACIEAYRQGLVACTDREAMRTPNDYCNQVFAGAVALGGTCSQRSECVQNAEKTVTCDTGICTATATDDDFGARPHGTAGSACISTCYSESSGSSSCSTGTGTLSLPSDTPLYDCWVNDGFVCGSTGVCEATPTLGQACIDYCVEGAYCRAGICEARTATGSCAGTNAACAASTYCDSTTYQCTPLKANGTACNYDDECAGGECYGDVCRTWSVATTASCSGLLDD